MKGQKSQPVEWMDPTKIRIHKPTKWTDTMKGQNSSP